VEPDPAFVGAGHSGRWIGTSCANLASKLLRRALAEVESLAGMLAA
jgi:hypothetical protein